MIFLGVVRSGGVEACGAEFIGGFDGPRGLGLDFALGDEGIAESCLGGRPFRREGEPAEGAVGGRGDGALNLDFEAGGVRVGGAGSGSVRTSSMSSKLDSCECLAEAVLT